METKPKVLKWALIIGIVVVLNLFFNYAISLFYKVPDYNTYFPPTQIIEPITNKADCLSVGGQWTESSVPASPTKGNLGVTVPVPVGYTQTTSYCDPNFTKQQEYNDAMKVYERNVFIVLVVLGVLSLVAGAFVANEILVFGFSWGGVLSIVIASMRYWSLAGSIVRVLILAFALCVLIWLAIKKFNK